MERELPDFTQKKLIAPNKLAAFSDEVRKKGKRLATLNGSFICCMQDILISFMKQASRPIYCSLLLTATSQ